MEEKKHQWFDIGQRVRVTSSKQIECLGMEGLIEKKVSHGYYDGHAFYYRVNFGSNLARNFWPESLEVAEPQLEFPFMENSDEKRKERKSEV